MEAGPVRRKFVDVEDLQPTNVIGGGRYDV
jgi:hypothetical protein